MLVDIRPRFVKPPFGSVGIDWGHPLARGLKHAWLLNDLGGPPQDLVTNGFGTLTSGVTWISTISGPSLNFAAGTDKVKLPETPFGNGSITFLVRAQVPTSINNNVMCGTGGASGTVKSLSPMLTNTLKWKLNFINVASPTSAITASTGNWVSVGMAYSLADQNIRFHIYDITARSLALDTQTQTNLAQSDPTWLAALANDANGAGWIAPLSLVLIFGRALSNAEMFMFHFEPYAFLRPVPGMRYWVLPAAAVGGATLNTGPRSPVLARFS